VCVEVTESQVFQQGAVKAAITMGEGMFWVHIAVAGDLNSFRTANLISGLDKCRLARMRPLNLSSVPLDGRVCRPFLCHSNFLETKHNNRMLDVNTE